MNTAADARSILITNHSHPFMLDILSALSFRGMHVQIAGKGTINFHGRVGSVDMALGEVEILNPGRDPARVRVDDIVVVWINE